MMKPNRFPKKVSNNAIWLIALLMGFSFLSEDSVWAGSQNGGSLLAARSKKRVSGRRLQKGRKMNLQQLKKEYIPDEQDASYRVVQKRSYTKARKLNFGGAGGLVDNDPFLTTYGVTGWLGYNFSEVFGVNLYYWKMFNSVSTAETELVTARGFGANNNPVNSMIHAELIASVLYGKLSLLGKAILHFDFYFMGGVGYVNSLNGNLLAPMLGVGQQIFLSRRVALKFDYRIFRFQEEIRQLYGASAGTLVGSRANYTSSITLGFNIFLF